MGYRDLRDFIAQLEARGELRRVAVEVDPRLEMTEICDRVLKAGGPALLFEQPDGISTMPVLGNLFGTPQRVALAMGADGDDWRSALREIGDCSRSSRSRSRRRAWAMRGRTRARCS